MNPLEFPPPLIGPSIAAAAFGGFWIGYTIREWQEEMKGEEYSRARAVLRLFLAGGLVWLAMWGTS